MSVCAEQVGTAAGYGRHRKAGEPPCDPCLEANAAYHRAYRRRRQDKENALVVAHHKLSVRRNALRRRREQMVEALRTLDWELQRIEAALVAIRPPAEHREGAAS